MPFVHPQMPIFFPSYSAALVAFCLFEAAFGAYWPAMATLRAEVLPVRSPRKSLNTRSEEATHQSYGSHFQIPYSNVVTPRLVFTILALCLPSLLLLVP